MAYARNSTISSFVDLRSSTFSESLFLTSPIESKPIFPRLSTDPPPYRWDSPQIAQRALEEINALPITIKSIASKFRDVYGQLLVFESTYKDKKGKLLKPLLSPKWKEYMNVCDYL
jgi:hypothetical protein